jgi:Ulp1 family protease
VGCFDFSVHAPNFFTNISFYDSLERNSRRILCGSTAAKLVHKVNTFFNNFILHEAVHRHLQQLDGAILRTVLYESCPELLNGFDCGIFAVTVCLHLSEQKSVDRSSFSQGNATEARTLLSACLCDKLLATLGLHYADKEDMDTSKRYFRGAPPYFPATVSPLMV